jgi:hypothetical protein
MAPIVNARVERRYVTPAEVGVPAIGHMDFFASDALKEDGPRSAIGCCPIAQDARITRLRLTPASERASHRSRDVLQELNVHLKHGFTEAELAVVARWLEQAAQLDSEISAKSY